VVQSCQGLSLVAKTPEDFIPLSPWLQHFDGYTLAILIIRALGQIDDRHAATPNLAEDAVRPDPFSRHRRRLHGEQISGGTTLKKGGGAIEARQQRLYFGA
jgi:hypothetical protein